MAVILVDTREAEHKKNKELIPLLSRLGLKTETTVLPYGDICIEGKGPEGSVINIGIERKKIGDMLNCIEDARYNSQRIGMNKMYKQSVLLLEGVWAPGGPPFQDGVLIVGNPAAGSWRPYAHPGGRRMMYHTLYRYLLSVALSGVIVTYCRDIVHTAFNIAEIYHYFQKKWEDHTSLLQPQKLAIPDMNGHPSVTRMWAVALDGVGVKLSEKAERKFRTPRSLAEADEVDWMEVGVNGKVAREIVKQIMGGR